MSTTWRVLPSSSKHAHLPPLLIRADFTSNSYAIYLTDLTTLWSEALDRRAIFRRSLSQDTSIDPSEDAEQMQRFLREVKRALAGEDDTALALSASKKDVKSAGLILNVTVKLPKPLKALEWPIHLEAQPQSALTARLTIPLLRAQNARMREMRGLVEILREKDVVIQKLVDKLEATGAELGHVFPGAAGKGGRKVSRKVAEERVKGLAVFEREGWERETRERAREQEQEEGNGHLGPVLGMVFAREGGAELMGAETEIPDTWEKWWTVLEDEPLDLAKDDGTNTFDPQDNSTSAAGLNGKTDLPAKDEEDDFQVQATPPQSRSPSPAIKSTETVKAKHVIVDSTDDEDDLDAPSQPSAVPDSYPAPKPQQPRKLGTIGRSNPAAKEPPKQKSPDPPASTAIGHPTTGDDTATEDEDDAPKRKSTTPAEKAASPAPAPKPKKGGLGKIGGRKKTPDPPVAADEEMALRERQPKPKNKIGHIGHKAETPEPKAEPAKEAEKTPEAVETEDQKADRKREELKRQLAEKANAPAKKKRKF